MERSIPIISDAATRTYVLLMSFILIVALLFSSSAGSFAQSQNFTDSFESKVSSNDYVYHGENAKFSQTNSGSQAHQGNRALKIVSTNTGSGTRNVNELTRWMTRIDRLEVTEGEEVKAEVYMKSQDVKESAQLSLSFFGDKAGGSWGDAWLRTASSSRSLKGTMDWTKVTLTFEAPAGAKYVRPEFRLYDSGTLWIDSLSFSMTGGDLGISDGNENVAVFETPGKSGPNFGAQVVLNNSEFIWVTPACKANLIQDGNEVGATTWQELNGKYEQLKTGSLTCKQVREYTESSDPAMEPIEEEPSGPSIVVGPEEPAGGSTDRQAIKYEGPDQYDWSAVPLDESVRTTIHGINRGKGQQLFTVDCKSSHFRNDDFIVFPDQPGASHTHEFFGDTAVNAHTDIQDLLDHPGNTCDVGSDRSAYWVPAVYQDGKRIEADNNKFYYKVGKVKADSVQPMPVGLRMIAGNANATNPVSRQVMYYFATTSEGKHTEPHTQQSTGKKQLFTTRANENGIRIQVQFPQCWDGEHLWLENTAHMAYPERNTCPASHPVAIPQVMFNLGYTDATGGDGLKLSSGEWYTAHADFVNGWHPETQERLIEVCINSQRYCGLTQDENHSNPCNARSSVRAGRMGCVELNKDNPEPKFFGTSF